MFALGYFHLKLKTIFIDSNFRAILGKVRPLPYFEFFLLGRSHQTEIDTLFSTFCTWILMGLQLHVFETPHSTQLALKMGGTV